MSDFILGQVARLSCVVTNADNIDVNPSTLRLKILTPAKVTTIATYPELPIVKEAKTGHFHADIELNIVGTYYWRWESDTPDIGASEGSIKVNSSRFTS